MNRHPAAAIAALVSIIFEGICCAYWIWAAINRTKFLQTYYTLPFAILHDIFFPLMLTAAVYFIFYLLYRYSIMKQAVHSKAIRATLLLVSILLILAYVLIICGTMNGYIPYANRFVQMVYQLQFGLPIAGIGLFFGLWAPPSSRKEGDSNGLEKQRP